MTDIYEFLSENGIAYERFDHPPVYTVDDVKRLTPDLPGVKTKNLFLRDAKGKRHFLLVVPHDKRVDMKAVSDVLGAKRVSFGSADRLQKHLGIEPGSVSLLAVFNDPENAVELFVDRDIWNAEAFQFHPLVNTSTLVISRYQAERFAAAAGHEIRLVAVPAKAD